MQSTGVEAVDEVGSSFTQFKLQKAPWDLRYIVYVIQVSYHFSTRLPRCFVRLCACLPWVGVLCHVYVHQPPPPHSSSKQPPTTHARQRTSRTGRS